MGKKQPDWFLYTLIFKNQSAFIVKISKKLVFVRILEKVTSFIFYLVITFLILSYDVYKTTILGYFV